MPDAAPPLLEPDLCALGASCTPVLRGGRCECGFVFFPHANFRLRALRSQRYGVTPYPLAGRGILRAVAIVHVHADDKRKAPFVIGAIELDEGPIVRSSLDGISAERNIANTRSDLLLRDAVRGPR